MKEYRIVKKMLRFKVILKSGVGVEIELEEGYAREVSDNLNKIMKEECDGSCRLGAYGRLNLNEVAYMCEITSIE